MPIHAGISFNLDPFLIQGALPLFEAGEIDALEWSFDTLFKTSSLPEWFTELLTEYGKAGRLYGHGVFFSLFSGKYLPEQAEWLIELADLCNRFTFSHITEHFGFLTGQNFHSGAPLPVPFTPTTLAIGQDRLMRIANACQCPVGIENLAFATHAQAATDYNAFLDQLVAPINGFLILDLHNLYCQIANFGFSPMDALAAYPLDKVREIHISGGSWEPSAHRPSPGIRRDTHNDRVPEAVWQLLETVLPKVPNLVCVIVEHMGIAMQSEASQQGFREDYLKLKSVLSGFKAPNEARNSFLPPAFSNLPPPLESATLFGEQQALTNCLETADTWETLHACLAQSVLSHSDWRWETWDPAMLETAWKIAHKWKDGFKPFG